MGIRRWLRAWKWRFEDRFPNRIARALAELDREREAEEERFFADLRLVDGDLSRLPGEHDRLEAHRRAKIAEARAAAPADKEPFDLERLLALYWPDGCMSGRLYMTALSADEIEEGYYVGWPASKHTTLASYAEHLRLMDVYDPGGSD